MVVMMTKMGTTEQCGTDVACARYGETTYWYSREHEDGNVTGRVPLSKENAWELVMINYNNSEEQSLIIEYGGAVQAIMASVGTIAAAMTVLFAF